MVRAQSARIAAKFAFAYPPGSNDRLARMIVDRPADPAAFGALAVRPSMRVWLVADVTDMRTALAVLADGGAAA